MLKNYVELIWNVSKVKILDFNGFLGAPRKFIEAIVEKLVDAAKATDIDEIHVNLTFPKHENGIAHVSQSPIPM